MRYFHLGNKQITLIYRKATKLLQMSKALRRIECMLVINVIINIPSNGT